MRSTPINGVVTMARILDDTKLTIDQQEMTRTIRQSSGSLLTIINDILNFSKIEAGKLTIEAVDFDLLDRPIRRRSDGAARCRRLA